MKKIVAMMLALMLVLVSVSAMAADGAADYKDKLDKAISLPKKYTPTNGTAPAETFTFKFTKVSYKDPAGTVYQASEVPNTVKFPEIENKTIAFDAITTETQKEISLGFTPADYDLGVYTYEIEEVIPATKTAGVTYETKKMYLVLTILSEGTTTYHYVAALHKESVSGSKTDSVNNSYDSGALEVKKVVDGNQADLRDKFDFTITFTAEPGTQVTAAQKAAITVIVNGGTDGAWASDALTYTVKLGNDDTVSFANLPKGVTYTISEVATGSVTGATYESFETTVADGTITGGDEDKHEIKNTKTTDVDTGIALDTVPYLMIMAIALMGVAMMIVRRREEM